MGLRFFTGSSLARLSEALLLDGVQAISALTFSIFFVKLQRFRLYDDMF